MSIAHLRKWTDTDATLIWCNAYGSFVDMLQAVLVDGYGSQAPLGWSKEYESPDTNTIVFRNDSTVGTGVFLQASHAGLNGYTTNYAEVALFESMSDWNTGMARCPTVGTPGLIRLGRDAAVDAADGIHWIIVGDELGFWFCWRPYMTRYPDAVSNDTGRIWHLSYMGDYIPIDPANPWPCFIAAANQESTDGLFGKIQDLDETDLVRYWAMRDTSYAPGSVPVGVSAGTNYATYAIGYAYDLSPINGQPLLTIPTLHDANQQILGYLPGLRNPLTKYGDRGANSYTWDEEFLASDRTMHQLVYRGYQEVEGLWSRIDIISGEGFRDVL